MAVFGEDWGANYGSAYLVTPDDVGSVTAELVEDGPDLLVHDSMPSEPGDGAIAFVDGVRRGEAALWQEDDAGRWGRGVAGGHACGAVLADAAGATFGECRVHRMIIWGSGLVGGLPSIQGGWSWAVASVADPNPDAPAKELQTRMRQQEGLLAEDLCAAGYLTIVDGPLNFVRSRDLPVVGYVKTHHRAKDDLERASIGCPAEHVVGRIELIQREVVGDEPRHSPACQSRQYRQVLTPGQRGSDASVAAAVGPMALTPTLLTRMSTRPPLVSVASAAGPDGGGAVECGPNEVGLAAPRRGSCPAVRRLGLRHGRRRGPAPRGSKRPGRAAAAQSWDSRTALPPHRPDEAFAHIGGVIREREPGRFEISQVPAELRRRDRQIGSGAPMLRQYERVTFEKDLIAAERRSLAEYVTPGHPLLDGTIDLIIERHDSLLRRGTVLIDENDPGLVPHVLVYLQHSVVDGRADQAGNRRVVSRRFEFVSVDPEGTARAAGWAPYLDLRPATSGEIALLAHVIDGGWVRADLENAAMGHGVGRARAHLEEVRRRTVDRVERTTAAVKARLESEIRYWDHHASQLKERELAGKLPPQRNELGPGPPVPAVRDAITR